MKRSRYIIPFLIAILFGLVSCSQASTPSSSAPTQEPAVPVQVEAKVTPAPVGQTTAEMGEQPVETTAPQGKTAIVRGPGDFDLLQPAIGLDSLSGYSQHFEQHFVGQKDGASYTFSTVITHTVVQQPAQELSAIQTDQDGEPLQVVAAKIGAATYVKYGTDTSCQGTAGSDQGDLGSVPAPASLLPLVAGAEKSGEEELNGIPTVRYTFDQRALPRYAATIASGTIWTAKEGGWVVKYALEMEAPDGVLGVGLAGKQTWLYEVQSGMAAIDLPAGCVPVLTDFPVSSGAQSVERMSGSLHYFTDESLDQVSSYYQDILSGQGWKQQEIFESTADEPTLTFVLPAGGSQKVAAILLQQSDTQTEVVVTVFEEALP